MNKYQTWYKQITERGQLRVLDSYTESHHIIPKSLNGTDAKDNITHLTAREHFICHWLLTKIHSDGDAHWKMLNALRIMRAENAKQTRYNTIITSRVYSKLKQEYSSLQSKKMMGENNPMYGRPVSDEVKQGRSNRAKGDNNPSKLPGVGDKIKKSKTGVKRSPFSDEWKAKMSASASGENNSRFGVKVSEATREKLRQKKLGTKQSPETIAKKAEAIRGLKREKQQCPHCKKLVAVNGLARWHGEKCKNYD